MPPSLCDGALLKHNSQNECARVGQDRGFVYARQAMDGLNSLRVDIKARALRPLFAHLKVDVLEEGDRKPRQGCHTLP